jgi:RNA polymerase sigma factor, sigma-70 family
LAALHVTLRLQYCYKSMDSLQQSLTAYAYNIIGSYEDAKDVVQDVLLEKMNRPEGSIDNEKAYLTRSVINRAINAKNRQKKLLSSYRGEWLPEPVATEKADHDLHQKDILSYSLMVLLEKLDPKQRAVFILKEAFDYDHEEIAKVLDISVENSRKILSRARKELRTDTVHEVTKAPEGYLSKFIDIIHNGDTKKLEQLLNDDIVLISDGGGKVAAALYPVEGKEKVLAFLSGIYRKFYYAAQIVPGNVNHHPALFYYMDGALVNCQVFELQNGQIHRTYFIRNPDKLSHLK